MWGTTPCACGWWRPVAPPPTGAQRGGAAMPHPPRPIRAWRLPAQRAPSFGQAAAAEAALDRELVLHLGALPLLVPVRARLAYDLTSVAFCGAYEEADLVRFGYSRDHRPDRKQVEVATTVALAGGVPLDYRVLAGNVADCPTPVDNLRRLQTL